MSVTFNGQVLKLYGDFPKKGEKIKHLEFTKQNLTETSLKEFKTRKILNLFPSIDTGVCATSVRQFNQKAASLENTIVLCISADLPFAQSRFCGAEGITNLETLSTFRHPETLKKLGLYITNGALEGLSARAVIVLDENNQILHAELVSEIKNEPNYDAALNALS